MLVTVSALSKSASPVSALMRTSIWSPGYSAAKFARRCFSKAEAALFVFGSNWGGSQTRSTLGSESAEPGCLVADCAGGVGRGVAVAISTGTGVGV